MLLDKDSQAKAEGIAELLQITKANSSNLDNEASNPVSQDVSNLYGVFDSAAIKGLWLDLDSWKLAYLPLYDGEHEKIAEAIPYVIHLDYINHYDTCIELLSHSGKNAILLMKSQSSLPALVKKLRYFYHVQLLNGKAGLRRYFDARFFPEFIANLNVATREMLFDNVSYFAIENNKHKEDNKHYIDFYSRTELTLDINSKEIPLAEIEPT